MAYSQSDLDTLQGAIATGALEVQYADGRRVRYRSLDDMRKICQEIKNALGYRAESRVVVVEHRR
jgi:hypothetical protein